MICKRINLTHYYKLLQAYVLYPAHAYNISLAWRDSEVFYGATIRSSLAKCVEEVGNRRDVLYKKRGPAAIVARTAANVSANVFIE